MAFSPIVTRPTRPTSTVVENKRAFSSLLGTHFPRGLCMRCPRPLQKRRRPGLPVASSSLPPRDPWESWEDAPDVPTISSTSESDDEQSNSPPSWTADLSQLADSLRGDLSVEAEAAEALATRWMEDGSGPPAERAFLVGAALKTDQRQNKIGYDLLESLSELGRLAESAGLEVVGHTHQLLDEPNPRTYVGAGKVAEIATAVARTGAETVIFDDELSPGQLRNLERALGGEVRLCDRTALILDLFSQRAATREGQLQVELAQVEYQLPRLTRMWSHLERQTGGAAGQVKGMGEKQIEVDRRLLRGKAAKLRRDIEEVRTHRRAYRERRAAASLPVVALVGYTNAGKSTLLNRLTNAGVLAEDRLFATLDPTTRRISMPGGQEVLLSDTVGFIQKLPTQLVAAFRATLEEIAEATLLLHVVDASHPAAAAQVAAVNSVLKELGVLNVPTITVWNKVDACADPEAVAAVASRRDATVCVSAIAGEGTDALLAAIGARLRDSMVPIHALIPYANGDLVEEVHRCGVVKSAEYLSNGTELKAHVPQSLASRLVPLAVRVNGKHGAVDANVMIDAHGTFADADDGEVEEWSLEDDEKDVEEHMLSS